MQRDPAGYSEGPGLYAYVDSSLVRLRDPSGLEGKELSDKERRELVRSMLPDPTNPGDYPASFDRALAGELAAIARASVAARIADEAEKAAVEVRKKHAKDLARAKKKLSSAKEGFLAAVATAGLAAGISVYTCGVTSVLTFWLGGTAGVAWMDSAAKAYEMAADDLRELEAKIGREEQAARDQVTAKHKK